MQVLCALAAGVAIALTSAGCVERYFYGLSFEEDAPKIYSVGILPPLVYLAGPPGRQEAISRYLENSLAAKLPAAYFAVRALPHHHDKTAPDFNCSQVPLLLAAKNFLDTHHSHHPKPSKFRHHRNPRMEPADPVMPTPPPLHPKILPDGAKGPLTLCPDYDADAILISYFAGRENVGGENALRLFSAIGIAAGSMGSVIVIPQEAETDGLNLYVALADNTSGKILWAGVAESKGSATEDNLDEMTEEVFASLIRGFEKFERPKFPGFPTPVATPAPEEPPAENAP